MFLLHQNAARSLPMRMESNWMRCRIVPQSGNVFNIIQSRNVTIKGGTYPAPADLFLKVFGETSENIRLIGVDLKEVKKEIELEKNVKADAVKQEQ